MKLRCQCGIERKPSKKIKNRPGPIDSTPGIPGPHEMSLYAERERQVDVFVEDDWFFDLVIDLQGEGLHMIAQGAGKRARWQMVKWGRRRCNAWPAHRLDPVSKYVLNLNLSLGRLFGISLRWSSRESGASHLSPACETWDRSDHHVLINWKTSQPHFTLSNIPASENPPLLAFSCKPSSVEFASLPPSRNKPKQSSWLGSSGESLSETHQETHLQPNPPLPHLP